MSDDPSLQVSTSASKKANKAADKALKKAGAASEREEQEKALKALHDKVATSVENESYGNLPADYFCRNDYDSILGLDRSVSKRTWHRVISLDDSVVGTEIWVRVRLQECRLQGNLAFLECRQQFSTLQAVANCKSDNVDKTMLKWIGSLHLESVIDIYGLVHKPSEPIKSTTQQVELHIIKIFCVSKAQELPFQLRDANRCEDDEDGIHVGQDTRLDNRILDLRTLANQAILRVSAMTCHLFRQYLMNNHFVEIHSPKLISGASEGGANVFTLNYFNRSACLAQSPQLYKQMVICGDLDRAFEIGPVFRAENSNTHRHLCEFTGLDFEMAIHESYFEILDLIDGLFRYIFENLNKLCSREIETIRKQYKARPFTWLESTPIITYEEGIKILRESGAEDIPDDISHFDLTTMLEKSLGKLIYEKYKTDFFVLTRYPLGVRPFYTMPDPLDQRWSNSYDAFFRGEEILSGAQRIHDPDLLVERAQSFNITLSSIQAYIDSFKLGAFPHGGVGVGLERVVMLFLGLKNVRLTSLFPRDPKRLEP